jgi:hypothetical protein
MDDRNMMYHLGSILLIYLLVELPGGSATPIMNSIQKGPRPNTFAALKSENIYAQQTMVTQRPLI